MREPRNRVVQVRRFGTPDGLEIVDAPLPKAGPGEVRVRVLASGLEYTDTLIGATSTRKLQPAGHLSCWATMSSGKSISLAMALPDFKLATASPI
jgi:NADPH:quinone reductase-like Zn-dependent oxidoreductase